jgi:hypothetical protein
MLKSIFPVRFPKYRFGRQQYCDILVPRESNAMAKSNLAITTILSVVSVALMGVTAAAETTWTVYNQINSPLPTDYVASMDFDNDGNQYIGTSGGGLVLKQGDQWTIWTESNTGIPIDASRQVDRDSENNLWVAAASGDLDSSPYGFGLARLDGADSTWAMRNHGLEINQIVTGVIIDGQTRYISTFGGGITIYDDIGWIRYRYESRTEFTYADSQQQVFNVPEGTYIPSDFIRAIDFDPASSILWIATVDAGAVSKDGDVWSTFNMGNSGLPSNQLLSVRVNGSGVVALGTAGFGVAILEAGDWTVYNTSNSPMTNGFISTLEYHPDNGELWIGAWGGVWIHEPDDQWRGHIPPDNDFIWGEFYSDIAFDSSGLVWVSAYGGGVASLPLDSSEPPPDSLLIDVDRMFIYFYNNRPLERIFTDLNVDGAPELAPGDSISFRLDSNLGELYSFEVAFDDFGDGGLVLEGWDQYRYKQDGLMIFLKVSRADPSYVEVSIKDTDAEMIRENYQDQLTVTMGIGDVFGSQDILLSGGNQWDVPEMDGTDDPGQFVVFALIGSASATEDDSSPLALAMELNSYPNPFNGSARINFSMPYDASVTLTVFDLLGRTVDRIHSGHLAAGQYSFAWPTSSAVSLKSGVYFCRLDIGGQSISKKMTYLK